MCFAEVDDCWTERAGIFIAVRVVWGVRIPEQFRSYVVMNILVVGWVAGGC